VTFTWSAGTGISKYSLWLGTTGPGSNNLYLPSETTALSATVSGLPTDGSTIYARMWSLISGAWQWTDYTYSAAGTAPLLSFKLDASPSSQTGSVGESFSYVITVAPTSGAYPGVVQFAATGLPNGWSATFSPASIAANAGQQKVTMKVSAAATTAAKRLLRTDDRPVAALTLLLLPFAGAGKLRREQRRRGSRLWLLSAALLLIATTATMGCGSAFQMTKYTITVNATSGSMQQSTTVDLNLH